MIKEPCYGSSPLKPSILVPLLLGTAILAVMMDQIHGLLQGNDFGSILPEAALSTGAWLHFLGRRRVWIRAEWTRKAKAEEEKQQERPCWIRREADYIADYLNLARALRDKAMDRTVEAVDDGRDGILSRLESTTDYQEQLRAERFTKKN